ncbi:MAG: helix-turn-helix domain-containing protein [Coriobacteriales bacterium]|jgi:transcriptional regulator with XRE-family HTH domain|nr:helix-turn-helix domain-containing protein [Coriobacteriales bacterium]
MTTKEVLTELRKKNGLTQDQMADKLFVTRQAVSRWENGETTPNIDTLKLLSQEFDMSINALLGQPEYAICQSCGMPLQQFDELGTEVDGGASVEFCTYCYQNGAYTQNRSLEEMIEANLQFLDQWNSSQGTNYTEDEARKILTVHLATLKRWKTK